MEAAQKSQERTPRGQGDLLRERLIDAALEIVDEGELANLSIRGVTKRAGVSPTAFYLHFDNLEELMRACVERGFVDFRDRLRAASGGVDEPEQRLIEAGLAYIAFARDQPERYRLVFGSDHGAMADLEEAQDSLEVADAAFGDLVELVAAYVGSEDPRTKDLDILALGVWSGLHGYVTLLCHARPGKAAPSDEEYLALLADAWLGPPRSN